MRCEVASLDPSVKKLIKNVLTLAKDDSISCILAYLLQHMHSVSIVYLAVAQEKKIERTLAQTFYSLC